MGRVLLVDDEADVLRSFSRLLVRAGHAVVGCASAEDAEKELGTGKFDVVVTDLHLPGIDGIGFLRTIRAHDLDVPVIVMTGDPDLDSAMRAVEFGAFRYVTKPVEIPRFLETVVRAEKMHALARLKREALFAVGEDGRSLGDRASLEAGFESAIAGLWMACQPIVATRERRIFGYEALLRTEEPALSRPPDFLEAGARLGRLHEIGRAVRARVAAMAPDLPPEVSVFVNLHANDLLDDDLYSTRAPLSSHSLRVVLELTERSALDGVSDVAGRIRDLRTMGYRIAVDDLGAGYAGLNTIAQLEPDVVKLDLSIVRDVDRSEVKRRLIGSMHGLCREMGIRAVCEGVETASERDTIHALGGDLQQGYLFARPAAGLPEVHW